MTNNIISTGSELPKDAEYNKDCHKALGAKWATLNMLRKIWWDSTIGSDKEHIANKAKWHLLDLVD